MLVTALSNATHLCWKTFLDKVGGGGNPKKNVTKEERMKEPRKKSQNERYVIYGH